MPSKAAHLAAASENQAAIDYLCESLDRFPGWVSTVAFYKALHIVEALFAVDGAGVNGHTDDHRERNRVLKTTKRYQRIWMAYRELYQVSLIARYLRGDEQGDNYEVFSRYMPPDMVKAKVLDHWLHQVQKSAASLSGDASFPDAEPG